MYELIITNKNYSSWSMRSWVLMRQLGIPFNERLLRYKPGGFRPETPAGRVPCLVDGPIKIWDTASITGGARFAAVDASFVPVASRVQTYALPLPAQAAAYVSRLLDLPAVKEWITAGLAENFRDAGHEEEVLTQGVLLEDLRAPAK
jgi:glutathione S-transferase